MRKMKICGFQFRLCDHLSDKISDVWIHESVMYTYYLHRNRKRVSWSSYLCKRSLKGLPFWYSMGYEYSNPTDAIIGLGVCSKTK